MPKVVIDIATGLKNTAVFYVAISRVKWLEDLMFKQAFDFNCL